MSLLSADFDLEQFRRTLVNEVPDAVTHAAGERMTQFWSGGAKRVFGFSVAEALGRRSASSSPSACVPDTM